MRTLPLLAALGAVGCYDPIYGVPLDGAHDSAGGPALPAEVDAVFAASCAGGGCHVGGSVSPSLTYASIVDVPSSAGAPYVVPGDPDGSYLYAKLVGTQEALGGGGSTMPIGDTLSDADLATLSTWITDGALPAE